MKRIIVVLMLSLVLLCACAPTLPNEPAPLSLSYRGLELTVGMAADDAIAQLGDDYTVTEAESCAGQGMDRMYTYPSLRLYVFAPMSGAAVVSSVSYIDDGVETADGLRIGCTAENVVAVMGEPDEQHDARLTYRSDDVILTFGIRDGIVVSVVLTG